MNDRSEFRRRVFAMLGAAALLVLAIVEPAASQGQPSEAQILEALKGRGTRAIGNPSGARRDDAEERRLIEVLRSRPARSLTLTERAKIAEFAETKPQIDIEITFDYNSDVVGPKALKPLLALGRALSNDQLKGTVFLINGQTDGAGGIAYNQDLSERRAEAVKRLLVQEFGLKPDTLVAVGYGKARLKNATDPSAGENRRVQVVNTEMTAASGGAR